MAINILIQSSIGEELAKLIANSNNELNIYTDIDKAPLDQIEVALAWFLPEKHLRKMSRLRWIQSTGAGVDQFVRNKAIHPSVIITRTVNNPGLQDQVAEYVLGQILSIAIQLRRYWKDQNERKWYPSPSQLIRKRHVGVIGMGTIGKSIAKLLLQVGMEVTGLRRSEIPMPEAPCPVLGLKEINGFLESIHYLVLAIPLTDQTKGMINLEKFYKMKQTPYLINVARGGVLDENNLIMALDRGLISGAVLDVFSDEPLPSNHQFWIREDVVITPHIAGWTEAPQAAELFLENLKHFRMGEALLHRVDLNLGY